MNGVDLDSLDFAPPAHALTLEPKVLAEVSLEADIIVEATVTAVRYDVRRTVDVGSGPWEVPFTVWTLDVTETIRGAAVGEIQVSYLGGSLDGTRWYQVVGAPTFEIGEQVLVHAVADAHGTYRLNNWAIGVLRLRSTAHGDVTLAGQGSPLAALACDEVRYVAAERAPAEEDGVVPTVSEDPYGGAMPWADERTVAASCGGAP